MMSPARTTSALPTLVFSFILVCAIGVHAQTYKVLYNLGAPGDGNGPYAPPVFDAQGNLYGTTLYGGTSGDGTVYKLVPNGDGTWSESVLHSFTDISQAQHDPVVPDSRGNLYGEIEGGGSGNYGSVYELSPNGGGSWRLQTVYTFTGYPDGATPSGGLIFSGNQLFGVTVLGGVRNIGEVFDFEHLSALQWSKFVLDAFLGGSDSAYPQGPLAQDAAGNLYGVTGGGSGNSTILYKLTPNHRSFGWTQTILHTYQYPNDSPNGALLVDAAGNVYGTGREDGSHFMGTVYKLSPNQDGTWTYTVLYNFTGTNGDGAFVNAGLVMDAAGNLWGTTAQGGSYDGYYCYYGGCGIVFELTPSSNGQWVESIPHTFDYDHGSRPYFGLIQDGAGNLYGTAASGGTNNPGGVVYELTPAPGR